MEFSIEVILMLFVTLNNAKKTPFRIRLHEIHDEPDFRLHDDNGISLPSVGQPDVCL